MVEVVDVSDGRVSLRWSGLMSEEEINSQTQAVDREIERYGKVRVLIELDGFEGFSVQADWARVKWSIENMSKVECVAVVGPEEVGTALALVGVTTIDHAIEVFSPEERLEAEAWLATFVVGKG